jgi:intracellular sulfur oxidation DsrE/DsrF family protein
MPAAVFFLQSFNETTTMKQYSLNPGRRQFLGSVATGATAFGLSSLLTSFPVDAMADPQVPDDPESWTARIKGKHKIVIDATQPHGIYPFAWPRVFLMSNQSLGTSPNDCCAVVVLRHTAIPYAFDHEAWEKYKFGEVFEAPDPASGTAATRNPFWQPAKGSFVVPGIGEVAIGINELQDNGVLFGVCGAAINVFSATVAQKINQPAVEVKNDWMKHMLPNIQVVPSGVWALGRAQEKGCGYIFAG